MKCKVLYCIGVIYKPIKMKVFYLFVLLPLVTQIQGNVRPFHTTKFSLTNFICQMHLLKS